MLNNHCCFDVFQGLSYGGVQSLLGLAHTAGTVSDALPPPSSTLLSSFTLPYRPDVRLQLAMDYFLVFAAMRRDFLLYLKKFWLEHLKNISFWKIDHFNLLIPAFASIKISMKKSSHVDRKTFCGNARVVQTYQISSDAFFVCDKHVRMLIIILIYSIFGVYICISYIMSYQQEKHIALQICMCLI